MQIQRSFSCWYDWKEIEMASCLKKLKKKKGRQKQSTCQIGKKNQEEPVSHMWYFLKVVGHNSVHYLLSRGRKKICIDSTLRHITTLSTSVSWKDSLSQKLVKELDLNVKHFIQNSLFIETIRMWRQESWVIQLCM